MYEPMRSDRVTSSDATSASLCVSTIALGILPSYMRMQ